MNLNGKNAIVTGGCNGIGFGLAKELLRMGVQTIGIFDCIENKAALQDLRKEFKTKTIKFFKTDVRSRDDISNNFRKFATDHQYIDVLVNNAGIANENRHEDIILINLLGLINCTYEAMDHMSNSRNGRGGTVINVCSTAGMSFNSFFPVYNASKHGVLAFTKTMANETNSKLHGMNFIAICPGLTDTNLVSDMANLMRPDLVEKGLAFISSIRKQTVEQLAECFNQILPMARNGSVWIIKSGLFKEYNPDIFDPEEFVKS